MGRDVHPRSGVVRSTVVEFVVYSYVDLILCGAIGSFRLPIANGCVYIQFNVRGTNDIIRLPIGKELGDSRHIVETNRALCFAGRLPPPAALAHNRSQGRTEQNASEADREIHDFRCKLTTRQFQELHAPRTQPGSSMHIRNT